MSPTDPLAAGAIMRRLEVPRRMVSAIEGEGLFNDATALVAYRVAVTAVVAGSFSLAHAGLKFVVDSAGGMAIGLADRVDRGSRIREHSADDRVNVTILAADGLRGIRTSGRSRRVRRSWPP